MHNALGQTGLRFRTAPSTLSQAPTTPDLRQAPTPEDLPVMRKQHARQSIGGQLAGAGEAVKRLCTERRLVTRSPRHLAVPQPSRTLAVCPGPRAFTSLFAVMSNLGCAPGDGV